MKAPLSARIARRFHRILRRLPLAWALDSSLAGALRRRLESMRAAHVLTVLDAFADAGVRCWVVGGWGVDALLGDKTRRHEDLDLAFEVDVDLPLEAQPERAQQILGKLGFAFVEQTAHQAIWMPTRILMRDSIGRSVDLLPATYDPAHAGLPATPDAVAFAFDDDTFTEGTIAGRAVPCLSSTTQLTFHRGYPLRPVDRDDIAALCERFDLPVPTDCTDADGVTLAG